MVLYSYVEWFSLVVVKVCCWCLAVRVKVVLEYYVAVLFPCCCKVLGNGGGGYHDYEDHVKGGSKDCQDDACNNSATNVSCNGYE